MSQTEFVDVLVVDDHKNNRLTLRGLIKEYFHNVHVLEADSGITALSLLMRQDVDLIILDIQMPQMDGFETARIVQSRPKTRDTPIVFLTAAYKSEEFQKKGFELGAVDYLTKPIDTEELVGKLKTYLRFVQPRVQYHRKERENERLSQKDQEKLTDNQEIINLNNQQLASLNLIIGYLEALETRASELSYNDFVPDIQTIGKECQHLQDLIKKCRTFMPEK